IQYSLSKNDNDELLLTHNDLSHLLYLSPYQMLYHDGTFFFPKKEHIPIVEQVMSFGLMGSTYPIEKNQADVFISDVLPSLEEVGVVVISEQIKGGIVQVPLQAKL